ncbi:aldehyde dehydrogenase family protein [Rhizobium sp. P32RR-XVIII]|uniref:aldehyde dehydrogenase family protein n=1 Tax=Rhizobium sp. P32RR-XVIII TaxID=2726738 RepID=UPI001456AD96|nr:aldehyde dehydrogenase family protein [Rhizobium sp. P32RR-XVIII]NLS07359.1 aldehyde dehydrogenase family protein [Rhizobium sp. P32RR-XVIII]
MSAHAPAETVGKMLIDGKMVESEGGGWLHSVSPADETLLGRVPIGTAADMNAAVEAAERAQPAWAALPVAKRVGHLKALADAILARREEFAVLEALDTGNTVGPMRRDVENAVERIHFACGLAHEIKGETIPNGGANIHMTLRVPYGVVGRIIPFNHPIGFAASRIAPVLVTGNTTVIKPSEQSPLSASLLGELCAAHLPAGTVNIVTGGLETGETLVRHPRVKRIGFIGSAATGMAIQRAAAETAVKHVTLELGGKNPLIVWPDANLDKAVAAAVSGMNFGWQGQSCGSTSRLMLHEDIHDAFVERVLEHVRAIRVGHPLNDGVTMGPINSKAQYEKVLSYIRLGQEEGARLIFGGSRPQGDAFERGYWVEPTIFADVAMSMRLAREEIFGPVLSILKWRDKDDVIAMANDIDLGLTASVWTRDLNRALHAAQRLEAGYIWINGVGTHFRGVPYGGFKNSGVGREEGLDELLSYTEVKAVNILLD